MSGQGVTTPGLDRGLVPLAGSADSACFRESSRSAPQSWRGGLTALAVWPMFILDDMRGSRITVAIILPLDIRCRENGPISMRVFTGALPEKKLSFKVKRPSDPKVRGAL